MRPAGQRPGRPGQQRVRVKTLILVARFARGLTLAGML